MWEWANNHPILFTLLAGGLLLAIIIVFDQAIANLCNTYERVKRLSLEAAPATAPHRATPDPLQTWLEDEKFWVAQSKSSGPTRLAILGREQCRYFHSPQEFLTYVHGLPSPSSPIEANWKLPLVESAPPNSQRD